jgi:hypothetical protein
MGNRQNFSPQAATLSALLFVVLFQELLVYV